ncbi:MAG: DcaP family trimeric outer membrane transporter [Halioglobus sp.]
MAGTPRGLLPVALLCAIYLHPAAAATEAERIAALEAQLQQQQAVMQQQQQMLEAMAAELRELKAAQPGTTLATAPAPTATPASDAPAAPLPAGHSKPRLATNVYGFVQADYIYDFKRVDPDWEDTLRVTTIPTQSGTYGNDGDSIFSVRQSRLGIKGNYGPDITYWLEGELFGVGSDQGQTTFRLRQAWATYKNFGMGQTWSNFMDIDIFPNTIDYWGPTGMVFYRNQQARYTFPLGDDVFAVSLEDPSTALSVGQFRETSNCGLPNPPPDCESTDSTAGEVFQSYNDLPDLTARYRRNGDFGHFQVAGIVRKLGYERLDTGSKDYQVGWGINTSTGLKTWGADRLKLQVAYGKGIGNYMNDGGIDIAPDSADIFSAGAETVPTWGLVAYYDHFWNEKWASSLGWSMTDLDTSDGQAPTEFKQGQIASINLLHYPAEHVLMGTEFSWGQREDVDGNLGTDYRIQFSIKVDFDTGDLVRSN